jgi:hypothetical protein
MIEKIKQLLARIRKNKRNPYEPDLEVNVAALLLRLIRMGKKKNKNQKPKF